MQLNSGSREEDLIPVTGEIAARLRGILRDAGFQSVNRSGPWNDTDIAALKRFMGEKNYDNRLRDDDLIDSEVLDDIIDRDDPQACSPRTGTREQPRRSGPAG